MVGLQKRIDDNLPIQPAADDPGFIMVIITKAVAGQIRAQFAQVFGQAQVPVWFGQHPDQAVPFHQRQFDQSPPRLVHAGKLP